MAQLLWLALGVLLLASSVADAATANYTFTVQSMKINQLCNSTDIIAVNGQLPGPTIDVFEGDEVVVDVINASPYNLTIHWHGILQKLTPWADGPSMVTQCPIQPNGSYTYRFNVTGHEGTLWWHAHSSFLRATVYGPLIIRPRNGTAYPFPAPDQEVPVVLGEWWSQNVVDVEKDAVMAGQLPSHSDAFTVNGLTGQLVYTGAAPGSYYMAVEPHHTLSPAATTDASDGGSVATGILLYNGTSATATPAMPTMPNNSDSTTANDFYFGLRGLPAAVPSPVDVNMTIQLGLGQLPCDAAQTNCSVNAFAAAMNGVSFRLPTQMSLLEAQFGNASGVYTADFPDGVPPNGTAMVEGTKGLGTFAPGNTSAYNLVDPVARNTIAVPAGGWAVIRFVANNPGMWFFHCHLDAHVPMGLGMVFAVENGTTADSMLPPPPADLPMC
ncbi:unnamed protein product [Triticum turgidum subsp. durum]|uniref:Laccase n=1 Tax=Triticum turgidum subsp. durum TaxID=4567 RepID=A0A9R1QR93_TRITD|nr:unnamed protein product [Triticum turgidum subsp. durum]